MRLSLPSGHNRRKTVGRDRWDPSPAADRMGGVLAPTAQ